MYDVVEGVRRYRYKRVIKKRANKKEFPQSSHIALSKCFYGDLFRSLVSMHELPCAMHLLAVYVFRKK